MRNILLGLAIMLVSIARSQEIPVTTEQELEFLAELLGEEMEDDHYLQQLHELRKHPISINAANAEELRQLRWLTEVQIQNFLFYRRSLGRFISIYELQAVPGWDLHTIKRTVPFLVLENNVSLVSRFFDRLKNGDHTLLLRTSRILEDQKGYDKSSSNHYLGSKDKLLFRYKYRHKNLLQYGITGEKDPGEAFFRGAQSGGFDFYSWHFFIRKLGMIKALAVGDYTVNLGQGLIHWQSLAFRKSAEVMQVKKQSAVLLPYNSAGEYNFFRGTGMTLQKGKAEATGFISFKMISGNIAVDTFEKREVFTSFQTSGFHRTVSEIADSNKVGYLAGGGNINFSSNRLKVGLNAIYHQFSIPLKKNIRAYNLYAIEGKIWSNHSVDYSYTIKNAHFFGEMAIDKRGAKAGLFGALISLNRDADASIVYRNIDKSYQALNGNAFTESTVPSNEKGIYTGLNLRPATGWQLNAYVDMYRFPWLRYRVNAPSEGSDYLFQLIYQPNKQVEFISRYRSESKGLNSSEEDSAIHYINAQSKQSFRLQLSYNVTPSFGFKGRTEIIWYRMGANALEEGFLTYLQGNYTFNQTFSTNFRIQFVDTDSYNSRVYAYENDVLYSYSIPAFFDRGLRYYINGRCVFFKKLNLWVRWSKTINQNATYIGSGLERIDGRRRSEYRVQLQYIFK